MSSVGKANSFMKIAQSCGWETKWKASDDYEWVEVTATRGGEKVVITWMSNQLNGPPEYTFNGVLTKLHSAAVAKRTVQAVKPDLDAYKRRSKRASAKLAQAGTPTENSSGASEPSPLDPSEYTLPFDIREDPDSVILKAIRGNTLIWRNSMTGQYESEFVPHKIADGRNGAKVFNWDLENVFYLASSSTGRDYVSYMNINGVFRAVALEALIGVV